jgi:tight adherence protein C
VRAPLLMVDDLVATYPLACALTAGGLLGAAVWGLLLALRPPRTDLVAAVNRFERRRAAYPVAGEETTREELAAIARWLERQAAHRGWEFASVRHNLALTDKSLEQHLLTKAGLALFGLLLPGLLAAGMWLTGSGMPLTITLVVGLGLAALFFFVPDLSVAEKAARRRLELRRALSIYLDLVAMSLAGGRGIPEALPTSAAIGERWAFELIAHTLATARRTGVSAWVALGDLGQRTGISELQDLGSALSLVANDGARVRESLTVRASSLRRRLLAEAEGAAKKKTAGLSRAQIVLAVGFMIFLGYPAAVNIFSV